ncbi:MAG: hypothetical protein GY935_03415 [Gammaproteobacteria bacterium]|nr:hypothetical protein [Gammaproteobacteria bacterium]
MAPIISVDVQPVANSAGWHKTDVDVSFLCDDATSGVATCPTPVKVTNEAAAQVISGTVVDNAGNTVQISATINLDKTAPTINFITPQAGTTLQELRPVIQMTLADNLALDADSLELSVNGAAFDGSCSVTDGTATCTPNSDLIPGDTTLVANVSDLAGNMRTSQISFSIDTASDRDGDGVEDSLDAFPDDPNEWADLDDDGIGDNSDVDRDGDGISNDYETQVGTDPNDAGSTPPDLDGDGTPDSLDNDRDGDGVDNSQDAFPDDANESSDLDGDGIGDNTDTDRDGDGIDNTQDAFPNDAGEWADLDGDGIGDNADIDRDGDGVDNTVDSYPDDATRNRLAAVTGLQTAQQDQQVEINWQAQGESILQGYLVERRLFGNTVWQSMNTSLITEASFTDTTVENGKAYEYRIRAVDDSDIEGDASALVSQFVAYNIHQPEQLSAAWIDYQSVITWVLALEANEIIRVYRAEGNNSLVVYEGVGSSFADLQSHWNSAQSYHVSSVLTFDNPLSGASEQHEGPLVDIELSALPPIQASLQNVTQLSTNSWQVEQQQGLSLIVTGLYEQAINSVLVSLVSNQETLSTTTDSGQFQFVLRDLQHQTLSITITEQGAPADRSVALSLNVMADITPLSLQIDNPAQSDSAADSVEVSGSILNLDDGIASLIATSDRYTGSGFGLAAIENNVFFGELPLEFGENNIQVAVQSLTGASATASFQVNRSASVIPAIQFISHSQNQVVNTPEIIIEGRLYSSQSIEQLQLNINGVDTAITAVEESVYSFTHSLTLDFGYNQVVGQVQTPLGNSQAALVVYYQDSISDPDQALELQIATPGDQQTVNDEILLVRGQLLNASTNPQISINGEVTALYGSTQSGWLFNHGIDISGISAGDVVITIDASSDEKDPLQIVRTVNIDRVGPVLVIDNILLDPPAVNEIIESPFTLTGSVSDTNLAGITINGQEVVLQPGSGVNQYRIDASLVLAKGEQSTIQVTALDFAGNETSLSYEVLSNPGPAIEIIQPLAATEYTVYNNSAEIETIVRISNAPVDSSLTVEVGNQSNTQTVNQSVMATTLAIAGDTTVSQMRFILKAANGADLASQSVAISIIDGDNISLQLESSSPQQGDKYKEPHHPIQFYFNRPVALADLNIDVRETVHGQSYLADQKSGAGLGEHYQGKTVEIHKDQSPVAGALSLLPGERIVEFYPTQDLVYGARVFVSLSYQGEQLTRFYYDVRSNPTFVKISILDQAGLTVENLHVSIPELGLEGFTNERGALLLGAELDASQTVKTDIYQVILNAGQQNPIYGVRHLNLQLTGGTANELGGLRIAELSPDIAYRYLQSGEANNVLVGGDLLINTQNARLSFPNGEDAGPVHVQMASFGEGLYRAVALDIEPLWLYNLQPGPIAVSGSLQLQIKIPMLYGSHDYAPGDGTPVLLMGLDDEGDVVTPIGVGRVNNLTVVSEGEIVAKRLDFVGYQFIEKGLYTKANQYADGDISLDVLKQAVLGQ